VRQRPVKNVLRCVTFAGAARHQVWIRGVDREEGGEKGKHRGFQISDFRFQIFDFNLKSEI
jgi:hypothetical protein